MKLVLALRVALLLMLVAVALPAVASGEQASQPSSPDAGQLDAGGSHTCAVVAGAVRCWGLGFSGQLGYGNTANIGDNEKPGAVVSVNVGSGRTATAITAGDFHTCALLDDGSVRCWGFGADGRLGYGNTANIGDDETPGSVGPVNLGGPATAISAGGSHTCAVLVGGSVRCWGYGSDGRLGYATQDPVTFESRTIGDDEPPASVAPVDLGAPATAISVGNAHTCVVLAGGGVRCWGDPGGFAGGDGGDGRLGYANQEFIGDNETPSSHALSAVACPSATQCTAVDNAGQQVTLNPAAPGTPAPTTIDSNRALTAVACPSATQCTAVGNAGQQVTFDPAAPATPAPTTISNRALTAVACPSATQCTAVDSTGQQVTFNPAAPGTPTPTTIDTGHRLGDVACPSATQCTAVDDAGQQVTFDPAAPGTPAPTTIDSDRTLTGVACPSATQCTAVDSTGQQVTFNPAAPGTPTPTTIDTGHRLGDVACPSATQCTAVDDAGQQVTFNPAAPGTPTPTAIGAGRWLSAVACPSTTQCTAVGRAGQQVTFNPAAPGTPTPSTIDAAAPVNVGLAAVAISAGDFHTCAVLAGGSVRCWGLGRPGGRIGYNNDIGRGVGDNETPASVGPVDLGPGRTATAVTAGNHTCARLDNGTVRCWGPGGSGRLGYGNTNDIGDDEPPGSVGPVSLGATAAAISAGGSHTCARLDNAGVRCWGEGGYGRLGYGNENDIGDNETPAAAGPVDFGPPGIVPSDRPRQPSDENPPDPDASALEAQAARLRGLRGCLAKGKRHARRETLRARRLRGSRRTLARRHVKRHARRLRGACLKRWGRTPGVVTGLTARAVSESEVVLSFKAAGTDGSRPPAARNYVIRQSRRPIRSARSFRRAQALCGGTCSFSTIRQIGGTITLRVTDLNPRSLYFYSVAARDNVSKRLGRRSGSVRVQTR